MRAYMNMYEYTRSLANLYETPADILPEFEPDRDAVKKIFREVADDGRSILSEDEAKNVLDAYRIPTVKTVIVTTAEECCRGRRRDRLSRRHQDLTATTSRTRATSAASR